MKITIIGGGITGLSTALALNKFGFQCEVYERAKQLNEVGAGIWMQPNALKVLDWLGLGESVRENGVLLDQVNITNSQLVPFKSTAQDIVQDEKGNKIVAIHRATLQKILYGALPEGLVNLGTEFNSYEYRENQIKVSIGEKEIVTDLLIGADGINSKVRNKTFPNTSKRFSGQTCWRGISNIDLPKEFQNSGIESWGNKIREFFYWITIFQFFQRN